MKSLADKQLAKEQGAHPEIILRDFLSIDRTCRANQRTLLSFLRTGLYLYVSALAVNKVELLQELNFLMGIFPVAAALTTTVGLVNYFTMRKKIEKHYGMAPKGQPG